MIYNIDAEIGGKLYGLVHGRVYEFTISGILIRNYGIRLRLEFSTKEKHSSIGEHSIPITEVGQTYFKTREEAENYLKLVEIPLTQQQKYDTI